MKNRKMMNLSSRRNSFRYAGEGLLFLFRQEPNIRIHLIFTIAAVGIGLAKHIGHLQWCIITIVIGLVWVAEAFNTAIEMLCDIYCGEVWHPKVKIIKDISAAAVLLSSVISVITGILVFLF